MREFLGQLRMLLARQAAEVRGHGVAGSTAPRVAEQSQVPPLRQTGRRIEHREHAELHEVVAASARAELCPRAVLQPGRHLRRAPVVVHHRVLATTLEAGANPKPGFSLQRSRQFRLPGNEVVDRPIDDRHLHAARDVHAHRVGDHGVVGGKDATDRQSVALVRVGHQRGGHRNGELAGVANLFQRAILESLAEDLAGRQMVSRRQRRRGGAMRLHHLVRPVDTSEGDAESRDLAGLHAGLRARTETAPDDLPAPV